MSAAEVIPINARDTHRIDAVYLSPEQVSELFPGLTERRLQELRSSGRGPAYFKPTHKTVLYEESDVFRWVESTRQPTRDIY